MIKSTRYDYLHYCYISYYDILNNHMQLLTGKNGYSVGMGKNTHQTERESRDGQGIADKIRCS